MLAISSLLRTGPDVAIIEDATIGVCKNVLQPIDLPLVFFCHVQMVELQRHTHSGKGVGDGIADECIHPRSSATADHSENFWQGIKFVHSFLFLPSFDNPLGILVKKLAVVEDA